MPSYSFRLALTVVAVLVLIGALFFVGATEQGTRSDMVVKNLKEKSPEGWRDAQMSARIQPTTWVWWSFVVLMFITWFSWIKYGLVHLLTHKSLQEESS